MSTHLQLPVPLILPAQMRQADRDRALSAADADHREALARDSAQRQERAAEQSRQLRALLEPNTALTEQTGNLTGRIERLTLEIHGEVCATARDAPARAGADSVSRCER